MAIPELPWYGKLREIVAPTETVSKTVLLALILISIAIFLWGDAVLTGAWVVYWVSP